MRKLLHLLAGVGTFSFLLACGGASAPATPPGANNAPPGAPAGGGSNTAGADMVTAADLTLGEIDKALAEKGKTTTT